MNWILSIVMWVKRLGWLWFAVRMARKWGPRQWAIIKGIHDDMEARKHEAIEPLEPEQIAKDFNQEAEQRLAGISRRGKVPTRPMLNEMREDVWQYRNPGKAPKRIENARYRATQRAGKAHRR